MKRMLKLYYTSHEKNVEIEFKIYKKIELFLEFYFGADEQKDYIYRYLYIFLGFQKY